MKPLLSKISKQNETIISLLGRMTFPEEELKKMIMSGSKKPDAMIKAYNLCDGETGITEIARKASVAQSSLTVAVQKWEENGIVVRHAKENGSVYPQRLYKLSGV